MAFTKLVQDDSTIIKKEDDQSVNSKRNIATLVNIVVIIFFMKSNESYCKITFNIPKNSSIEILKLKNVYECKIKNNNTARYIDLTTPINNEYYITSKNNNLVVKNEINRSLYRPSLNMIPAIDSVIETPSRQNCHSTKKENTDKTSTSCPQSSITDLNNDKSQITSLQNHSTKPLLYSSLLFSDKYPITCMMRKTNERNLKHEPSIESKLKFKTFLVDPLNQIKNKINNLNKIFISNSTVYNNVLLSNLNESKLALKIHSPGCQVIRKKHATTENFSKRFYLKTTCEIVPEPNNFSYEKEISYGVLPTSKALATKMFQYKIIPQNNITMNRQNKVILMHNLHKTTHSLPKLRFINKLLRQEKLKNKWQKGVAAFGKEQPRGININRKRTILINRLNRLINKWINITTVSKLLQRPIHINTIRAKLIKSEQQPMESSPIEVERLLKFGYKNDTFFFTTEVAALNQLPTNMFNVFHTNDNLVSISNQSLQFDSDIDQNSSVNVGLTNSDNIILTSKVTKNARQTITDTAYPEINAVDITQTTEDLTIRYELYAQTVIQSEYLPSFNDMENSNSNISLRSLPHASSGALNGNKTMKNPKSKVLSKKVGKAKKSGIQSKATKLHKKSKTTEDTTKEFRSITMYKKIQPAEVSVIESLKQKQRKKLKLTSVSRKKYKQLKKNKKIPPTKVTLIKSIKEKQNKKTKPTKATAKKSVKQKQRKKFKLTVSVKKYKTSKQNKKVPPTKVSLIKSIKQKQNKKMRPTKATAKKSVKQKQRKKFKLTSVPVKKYKISKQNKKVPPTKVSLIKSIKQKQNKKMRPTKVTAKKSVKQKQHKKLKPTVSVKKYKISKHNQKVKPTKTNLKKLKTPEIQRKINKHKYSKVSTKKKHSKMSFITKKIVDKGFKHVKKTEKVSKHFKKHGTRSNKNHPKKSKSQSKKLNVVSIKSIIKIMTDGERKLTTKITEKNPRINTEGYLEENVFLINTTFALRNRSAELNLGVNYDDKVSNRDYAYILETPYNSYNNNHRAHHNVYVFVSSAITDRNNINNLIIVDFDTTPKCTTTTTPRPTPPPPRSTITHCPNRFYPTITFLKRTGFMEFNVIVTAIFLGAVVLLVICCCCCAPIIVVRRRNK